MAEGPFSQRERFSFHGYILAHRFLLGFLFCGKNLLGLDHVLLIFIVPFRLIAIIIRYFTGNH